MLSVPARQLRERTHAYRRDGWPRREVAAPLERCSHEGSSGPLSAATKVATGPSRPVRRGAH